jgi:hypothetical protein
MFSTGLHPRQKSMAMDFFETIYFQIRFSVF